MQAIIQRLSVTIDRERNLLWFRGVTTDGYEWGVGFPIGHVVLTFDSEAAAAGIAPRSVLGDVEIVSMDGLFSSIKKAVSSPFKAVASAASSAYKGTIQKLGQQAIKYGTSAAKFVAAPVTTTVHAVSDIAHGKNVIATARNYAKANIQNAATAARVVGNVASVVPGIGTGAAFALQYSGSIANAAATGKNLYNAGRDAAIKAALNSMPGGELTGAMIKTVANVALAGVQGRNILTSARNELVASAVGLVPDERVRAVLRAAADAALKGQNVMAGAQAAAVNAALARIPDVAARGVVAATIRGAKPEDIVRAAPPALLSRAAASAPAGGAATVVTAVTGANPMQIHAADIAHAKVPVRAVPARVEAQGKGWMASLLSKSQKAAPGMGDPSLVAPQQAPQHMGISAAALRAYSVAKQAARIHATANDAAARIQAGGEQPGDAVKVASGIKLLTGVQSLANGTPQDQMLRGALRALPNVSRAA